MEEKKNSEINNDIKKGFLISFFVLIGKALGFVKQAVIAWAFGADGSTDVLFAADGYTSMFGQITNQSISPAVLTNTISLDEENKKEEAVNLVRSAFIFFPLVAFVICGISVLLSPLISNLIGFSYSLDQKNTLRIYLISLCPVIFLSSITGVSQGFLESKHIFLPGKIFSFIISALMIGFVVAFRNSLGIVSILIGLLASYLVHCVVMLFFVNRRFRFRFVNPFKNKDFLFLLKKFVPLLISVSIIDFGHLIDRIIASSMETGSVSVLYYGQVISNDIVNAAVILVISTILLPNLTKKIVSRTTNDEIIETIRTILSFVCIIIFTIVGLYVAVGRELVSAFFERGKFVSSDSAKVYQVAMGYAIGFVFLALYEVISKIHYAFSDTFWPMIGSIGAVVVNTFLSLVFSRFVGVLGIAIATSISLMLVSVFLLFTLKKHTHSKLLNRSTFLNIFKVICSAILSCLYILLLKHFNPISNRLISLLAYSLIFLVLNSLFLILLKQKEFIGVFRIIKSKFSRNNI
ncbi:MAG: polysaccharide biosynthesis C-terminal domain-containing protein [Bacilli bacterium]|nr:polysaccharide biosynthesis C-terminal domain-containing protein [Bacilli bacterium]